MSENSRVRAAHPASHTDQASPSMQRAVVEGHGNSPAAWALVIVSLIGIVLAAIAIVIHLMPLFYTGVAVAIGGFILGFVLRLAGYGVGGSKTKSMTH